MSGSRCHSHRVIKMIAITILLFHLSTTVASACITEGYETGQKGVADKINGQVMKGTRVASADVKEPAQTQGLINASMAGGDLGKVLQPALQGPLNGFLGGITGMLGGLTGANGPFNKKPSDLIGTSNGNGCAPPAGAVKGDPRSYPKK